MYSSVSSFSRVCARLHRAHSNSSSSNLLSYQTLGAACPDKASAGATLPTVGLHGWLDNSSTFLPLSSHVPMYAPDFPGHGKSFHFTDHTNLITSYLLPTLNFANHVLDETASEKINLVGHSMGSTVALLLAATYPELVSKLVLIEGLGPLTKPTSSLISTLRSHTDTFSSPPPPKKIYPTIDACLKARMRTAELSPGSQYITLRTCGNLIARSTEAVEGGVTFTHDQRLKHPSHMYLTESQCLKVLESVTCPVLIVKAKEGWPEPSKEVVQKRLEALQTNVEDFRTVEVDGSHHCHSDEDGCDQVGKAIVEFFR
ncbi:hypothetical protein TrST_g7268 [Triparma strigata]|uniref:AB hydrolase-1 domain-containing protein n=1 Tax=Triparma strigata TaxID=1606541 RepID=A0A9W7AIJ1_9STRA|nr:hypothetical protein TrST_g7268 [Triparma strigata]